jgi:succinate dehydrogenase / fumarate reductase, iron-sulfur subunit
MSEIRTIHLRIKRQDTPATEPRWEEFQVPYQPRMNIISCLQEIQRDPRTRKGVITTPVTFDAGCLEEVCGSCTMVINGRVRQSCSALVDNLIEESGETTITLEPMSKFPVVRDLAVDRGRIFRDLKRIKAWIPIDGLHDLGPGPRQSSEHQEWMYRLSTCMSCGCCLEACPNYNQDTTFVGAAVISQVRLMNAHPTGAFMKGERLEVLMGDGGVTDCGNAQNCVTACPKEIPLTESIAAEGREVTLHALHKWFLG